MKKMPTYQVKNLNKTSKIGKITYLYLSEIFKGYKSDNRIAELYKKKQSFEEINWK